MRFTILSALLLVASIVSATAQGSGTVGYSRDTLSVAPTNLIFRAASITSKITNASIYGITGILKGDGIGGSVEAVAGVDYEPAGGGGGGSVFVNGAEVVGINLTNSTYIVFVVSGTNVSAYATNLTAAHLATDSVSADELNATGVESELESVLDLDQLQGQIADAQIADGAVDGGTGGEITDGSVTAADLGPDSVAASELDAAAVESELEAVLDFADLQGVPSGILVNPDSDNALDGEVFISAGTTRTNLIPGSQSTNTTILLQSNAGNGTNAFRVNAATTHTTGNLVEVQNNGTNVFVLAPITGGISMGRDAVNWWGSPMENGLLAYFDSAHGEAPASEVFLGVTDGAANSSIDIFVRNVESTPSLDRARITLNSRGVDVGVLNPTAADGDTPWILGTSTNHTTGNLVEVANNGTNVFTVTADGIAAVSADVTGYAAFAVVSPNSDITIQSDTTGAFIWIADASFNLNLALQPDVADGTPPYILGSSNTHTTGNLMEVANNGTNVALINHIGVVQTPGITFSALSETLQGTPAGNGLIQLAQFDVAQGDPTNIMVYLAVSQDYTDPNALIGNYALDIRPDHASISIAADTNMTGPAIDLVANLTDGSIFTMLDLNNSARVFFQPSHPNNGGNAYALDTEITHTIGNVLSVENGGTPFWTFAGDGGFNVLGANSYVYVNPGGGTDNLFLDPFTVESKTGGTSRYVLRPTTADGNTAYIFDTSLAHTSGNLVEIEDLNVDQFVVDHAGNLYFLGGTLSTPANFTLWDGTQASRTWTASLSGATDPVWTYANNSVSLNVPLAATTLDTGQGANELYDMDQNVLTTSDVTFNSATVATEAYSEAGWNGDNTVPTKDAISDKIEAMIPSSGMYSGAILTPWVDTNSSITLQWKKAPEVWEFINVISTWTAITANSGSTGNGATSVDTSEPGIYSFTTGTLTNGVAGWRLNTPGGATFTTNSFALEIKVRTPSALSTDADGYEFYVGFGDGVGDAESTDGAYFYYLHSVSNGVWTAKTASNSNRTFASGAASTVTVAVDTWYTFRVEGNSTVVNFWISTNDGVTWTWVGFSTGNIPSGVLRLFGPETYIRKVGGSVGTTARQAYIGRAVFWPNRAN